MPSFSIAIMEISVVTLCPLVCRHSLGVGRTLHKMLDDLPDVVRVDDDKAPVDPQLLPVLMIIIVIPLADSDERVVVHHLAEGLA